MDSKICVLCGKRTANLYSNLEELLEDGGAVLQSFNSEFNLLPVDINTDNLSICQHCLPHVQSVVQTKETVNKVELQVRRLQVEILKLLKSLALESGRMYEDLRKIQQIIGSRPTGQRASSSGKKQMEEKVLVEFFKERLSYVVRDLEEFSKLTLNKLLNNVEPSIKIEPEAGIDREVERDNLDINYDKPGNSESTLITSPAFREDDDDTEFTKPTIERKLVKRKCREVSKPKKTKKITNKTSKLEPEVNFSDDSSNNQSDQFSDEDFNPLDDIQIRTGGKSPSVFRRRLIKRIREARTISTSKNLPSSDEADPRKPYSIKYIKSADKFLVDKFEFKVNDSLKSLECVTCSFTIESSKMTGKSVHVEDVIFDHILGKHLNLYCCPICNKKFDLFAYIKPHYKLVHQKVAIIERKFVCKICGKPMTNNNTLREHLWTHLSDEEKRDPENAKFRPRQLKCLKKEEKRWECEICGYLTTNKYNFKNHQLKHLGSEERRDEKGICSLCGVEMLKLSLNGHQQRCLEQQRKMEEKFVKCRVCSVTCKSGKELDKHKKAYHPNDKIYECKICGKMFGSRSCLSDHRITHGTERKHVCDRCGASYKRKTHLKRHLKNNCGKEG